MSFFLIIAVVAAIGVLIALQMRRGGSSHTIVIRSPKLGILNLKGALASQIVATDKSAVASFFSSVDETTRPVPVCDVLFVYCDFGGDGGVVGSALSFREIIRGAGARVVIVASDNPAESCSAAAKLTGFGSANLVMTLDRKGEAFALFYRRLFGDMAKGVSMPVAWVKLAPQVHGQVHIECPDGLFVCEVGHVTFGSMSGTG